MIVKDEYANMITDVIPEHKYYIFKYLRYRCLFKKCVTTGYD